MKDCPVGGEQAPVVSCITAGALFFRYADPPYLTCNRPSNPHAASSSAAIAVTILAFRPPKVLTHA